MVGPRAALSIPVTLVPGGSYALDLELMHVFAGRERLKLRVGCGFDPLTRFSPRSGDVVTVPAWEGTTPTMLDVRLEALHHAGPEGATPADSRALAVGVARLRIRAVRKGESAAAEGFLRRRSETVPA